MEHFYAVESSVSSRKASQVHPLIGFRYCVWARWSFPALRTAGGTQKGVNGVGEDDGTDGTDGPWD